jgi:hypothetical protein
MFAGKLGGTKMKQMTHNARGIKRALIMVLALCLLVTFTPLMPGISSTDNDVHAAAATTLTLNYVDKAGATKTLETWDYANEDYTVAGTSVGLVKDFSTDAKYADWGGIPAVGQSNSATLNVGVVTKGITLDDLKTYVTNKGIGIKNTTTGIVVVATDDNSVAMTGFDAAPRYFYPSVITSTLLVKDDFNDENAVFDDSTRLETPIVFSIKDRISSNKDSYSGRTDTVENIKADYKTWASDTAKVSDSGALRNVQGLIKGNYTEFTLGQLCNKNIATITFTPKYFDITATGATIKTADGFSKASESEKVSFIVEGKDAAKIDVTAKNGSVDVPVTLTGSTFSFTMPGAAVAISVSDKIVDASAATIADIANQTFNGKEIKPVPVVTLPGATITSTDYDVTYAKNKAVGTATVTVTFKGLYKGTVSKTFKIVAPVVAKVKGVKATAAKKAFTVKWSKNTKVTGYEVWYGTNKTVTKGVKKASIAKNSTVKKAFTKLKAKKTYYYKVRTYKTVGGKKFYGAWSTVKTIKTK